MDEKVSVIIPTYKRSEFLHRAIDSVLNQTYSNIEVVVVDDNDPNSKYRLETEEKMKKYSKNTNVIYIKNNKNLGGALARNEGIFKASGDYITFLDDDDIYLPEKIERQLKFMLENGFDMTFTDLKLYNTKGELIDYREYKEIEDFSNENLLKYHIMRHITGTPTFMYKKEKLFNMGGFNDSKVGQEFYLMLKTIENNLFIGYLINSDVVAYVHDGERISKGANKLNGERALFEFKKKYFNRFNLREKMFIRFRHHAVMAVTGYRSKMFFLFLGHSFLAVLSSPIDIIIEPVKHIKKIIDNGKIN